MKTILVINTGSTSTKVAIFQDKERLVQDNLTMPEQELKNCKEAVEQLPYRTKVVQEWVLDQGYQIPDFDIIAARGGPLPPVKGGAYKVNQLMVDVLTYAPATTHESALACMIGRNLAMGTDVPVIVYDGTSVHELNEVARYTGLPGVEFNGLDHPLNTRRVSKEVARKLGKKYPDCTFVTCHLGGSITVSAHDRGHIVDVVNAFNGPMSVQRAGMIPTNELIKICYSGQYTAKELTKKLNGGSGFKAYFGTQNAREVSRLLDEGDEKARLICEVLAYQTSKAIMQMVVACEHPIDRIILTGGMANFQFIVDYIINKVAFVAPVEVVPGEFEMEALAEGGYAVLTGEEEAREFDLVPKQFDSIEDFYRFADEKRKAE